MTLTKAKMIAGGEIGGKIDADLLTPISLEQEWRDRK
jgi:hypothetical protein